MDTRFFDWLRSHNLGESTMQTRRAVLRRVERAYGDLDEHWNSDKCASILDDLAYTAEDERLDKPDSSKLNIDGNVRNTLTSHKSHLNSYIKFKEELEASGGLLEIGEEASDGAAAKQTTFGLEADLQDALRSNISQLLSGLKIADGGSERKVETGYIDILARDESGNLVVIEIKAVTAPPATLAQILSYMNGIKKAENKAVRGIIVAPDFHPKLAAAAHMVPNVELIRYTIKFSFNPEG